MLKDLPTRELYFALLVSLIAHRFACSATSWWRTAKRNAELGGHPASFHLEGIAADLAPDDPEDRERIKIFAQALGLDAADEGDHVHVELDYRRA